MSKHYFDDYGWDLNLDCNQDVSTATNIKVYIRQPDGTTLERTGSAYANNYIQYTTVSGDFSMAGKHEAQAHFGIDSYVGYSDTVAFDLLRRFD